MAILSSQIATRQALSDCWQGAQHDPVVQQNMQYQHQTHSASTEMPFLSAFDQPQLHPLSTGPSNEPRSDSISRIDSAIDITGDFPGSHRPNESGLHCQPRQTISGKHYNPLSSTLPLNSQQMLSGSGQFQSSYPSEVGSFAPSTSQEFTGRRYSYNPNGRPSTASTSPTHPQNTMPTGPVQISSSPSPLWLDAHSGFSLSPTQSGPPPRLHHDSPGIVTHPRPHKTGVWGGL